MFTVKFKSSQADVTIEEAKEYFGITQQDIAECIGATQPAVSAMKKNGRPVRIKLEYRVVEVLESPRKPGWRKN